MDAVEETIWARGMVVDTGPHTRSSLAVWRTTSASSRRRAAPLPSRMEPGFPGIWDGRASPTTDGVRRALWSWAMRTRYPGSERSGSKGWALKSIRWRRRSGQPHNSSSSPRPRRAHSLRTRMSTPPHRLPIGDLSAIDEGRVHLRVSPSRRPSTAPRKAHGLFDPGLRGQPFDHKTDRPMGPGTGHEPRSTHPAAPTHETLASKAVSRLGPHHSICRSRTSSCVARIVTAKSRPSSAAMSLGYASPCSRR